MFAAARSSQKNSLPYCDLITMRADIESRCFGGGGEKGRVNRRRQTRRKRAGRVHEKVSAAIASNSPAGQCSRQTPAAAGGPAEDEGPTEYERRLAWIKHYEKAGEREKAVDLGWDGDEGFLLEDDDDEEVEGEGVVEGEGAPPALMTSPSKAVEALFGDGERERP